MVTRRGRTMRIVPVLLSIALLLVPPSGCGRGTDADVDVVIVGGGIAGLLTSYELQKAGVKSHVLEMQHRLGGRVATTEYPGGLRAEAGLQEIWAESPLLPILDELKVPHRLIGGAYSSTILAGERHPFRQDTLQEYFASFLSPEDVAALTDWMHEAERLLDLVDRTGLEDSEVLALQSTSFQQWVDSYGLSPDAATWIRLTLGCEIATEPMNISALSGLLVFRIFLHGGQECYHVDGGNSRLIEGLASAIRSPITLDARVTEITKPVDADGVLDVSYEQDLKIHTIRARRVVVAIPFLYLHQIRYDPPLSGDRWGAVNSLGRGQYTVVHFTIDGHSPVLPEHDDFPFLTEGPLGVIYGPTGQADESTGSRIFSLLVYGAFAQAWHLTPRELMTSTALATLDAQWPGFSEHVLDTHVYTYHPAAVAFHPVGRSPLDDYSRLMRTPTAEGIRFVGAWTYGSHSHDAARSAIEAARAIAEELAAPSR